MVYNENTWDKLLKIKTSGRDASNSDQYSYPYEPTPYRVLERLGNSGLISKKMLSWIMAVAREEWISFLLIKRKQLL